MFIIWGGGGLVFAGEALFKQCWVHYLRVRVLGAKVDRQSFLCNLYRAGVSSKPFLHALCWCMWSVDAQIWNFTRSANQPSGQFWLRKRQFFPIISWASAEWQHLQDFKTVKVRRTESCFWFVNLALRFDIWGVKITYFKDASPARSTY